MSNDKIQNFWYNSDVYKWNIGSNRAKFAIDTPPPTVSGHLHMGHVFSYTQADFIARFKRMMGYNVYYPIGFDDNGLPTEKLTEKIHGVRGVTMAKEGRKDEFMNLCKQVVDDAELEFEKLFKALGLSFDWSQKYQTISDESIAVAHASFDDLLAKGLVYQANNPVYYCTVDRTAIAQAEIEDKEKDSEEIVFKCLIDGVEHKIMTTRPELIPACVMVLFNPADTRFKNGQMVKMPFLAEPVPLYADEDVAIDKGTGLVMCCSYGDWQDVIWIKRHGAKSRPIISNEGKIGEVKVLEARKNAIENLGDALVSKTSIKHTVKVAERSGAPIEIIETQQWYVDFGFNERGKVNSDEFKANLLTIVEHIEFKPPHLKQRLESWIAGLNQDWCISRDRFSGVPIPGSTQVFDTWFTSSVSPQLNTKAIKFGENAKHDALFPFDLRPQAHEIIRTWAFYTIVKAYLHGDNNYTLEGESDLHGKSGRSGDRMYNTNNIKFAKEMRSEMTKEEFALWCKVNNNQLGFKFRRQQPIGNFIADFACLEKKLIIEIDGSQHAEQELYDNQRTAFLNNAGFKVIRFWNSEIMANLDDCVEYIVYLLNEKTPPQISFGNLTLPQGAGSKPYLLNDKLYNSTLEGESDLHGKSGGGIINDKFMRLIPWKTVMLSGWCLAADKTKMSKSKGNVITPMPLIEEKGADVVRYWASCSHLGVDTHFNETKFVDGKKLINKLKNVAKFIAPYKQKINLSAITEVNDRWAINKLNQTISAAKQAFEEYNYCGAREITEKFFWNTFCDNYLEIIKGRIYGEQGYAYKYDKFKNEDIIKLQQSAVNATLVILQELLKLFAPVIPFTTEEIWQETFNATESIHKIGNFAQQINIDQTNIELGDYMLEIIEKVRKYKADNQLSVRAPITQITLPKLPKAIELDLLSVINAFEAETLTGEFDCM